VRFEENVLGRFGICLEVSLEGWSRAPKPPACPLPFSTINRSSFTFSRCDKKGCHLHISSDAKNGALFKIFYVVPVL
jgi:hypothetical protein